MKNSSLTRIFIVSVLLIFATTITNCVAVHHPRKTVVVKQKRIPPGHAKKISGDKSARKHAPGHNK